jgi:hypothetical protein
MISPEHAAWVAELDDLRRRIHLLRRATPRFPVYTNIANELREAHRVLSFARQHYEQAVAASKQRTVCEPEATP